MLVENLCEDLKTIKEFARERSPYDQAKNVRITGNEDEVTFYCCDGEVAIWKKNKVDGNPILGDFSINIFSLFKILKTLPQDADVGIKANKNYHLSITTPLAKIPMRALPPEKVLEIPRNKNWKEETQETFIESLRLLSLLAVNEAFPITYDGEYIYYVSRTLAIYKRIISDIMPFKLTPKVAKHIFSDVFTQMNINEKSVNCRNKNCEIMLFQTLTTSVNIRGVTKNINDDFKHIVYVKLKDLLEVYKTIASLKEVEKEDSNAIDLTFEKDQMVIDYIGARIEIPCSNIDGVSLKMRVPMDHLESVTSTREGGENGNLKIILSLGEYQAFVVDKGNGIIFVGGLIK
jgi:hypothetical protein